MKQTHPIIEAMARAAEPDDFREWDMARARGDLGDHVPGTVLRARAKAASSLRALAEAEPTPKMRRAFYEHEDPTNSGFDAGYRAMLLALLDEVDHVG